MKPWKDRSVEESNLLNPAFGCVVMSASVFGFQSVQNDGMPFPLAFTVLPIVWHKPTRSVLPTTARTPMAIWLQEHAEVKVQFVERVLALKPHTRETMLLGANQNWLGFVQAQLVCRVQESDLDRAIRRLTDEARECATKAKVVGKWFASVGTTETSMHLWGIRP